MKEYNKGQQTWRKDMADDAKIKREQFPERPPEQLRPQPADIRRVKALKEFEERQEKQRLKEDLGW